MILRRLRARRSREPDLEAAQRDIESALRRQAMRCRVWEHRRERLLARIERATERGHELVLEGLADELGELTRAGDRLREVGRGLRVRRAIVDRLREAGVRAGNERIDSNDWWQGVERWAERLLEKDCEAERTQRDIDRWAETLGVADTTGTSPDPKLVEMWTQLPPSGAEGERAGRVDRPDHEREV